MANVFLSEEAYAKLKAVKEEKESFSEVVIRCTHQQIDWKKYLGSCKGIDTEKIIKEIKKGRSR